MSPIHPFRSDLLIRWYVDTLTGDPRYLQLTVIDCTGRRYDLPTTRQGKLITATFPSSLQRFVGWYDVSYELDDDFGHATQRLHHAFTLASCVSRPVGGSVLTIGADSTSPDAPLYIESMALFVDGADNPTADDLLLEASLLDFTQSIQLGSLSADPTRTFTFSSPCLWVLIPASKPQFVSARDADAGFMFPFEKPVTLFVRDAPYLAYRSNAMQLGITVTVTFNFP